MEDGDYSTLDFDLMDQILIDGFWLETETYDGSNLWQPISNHHLTSPPLHENINSLNTNSPHQDKDFSKESMGKSNFFGESSFNHPPLMEDDLSASGQARNNVSTALNHHSNLLVGPDRNKSVKKRFDQAVEHLKDCVRERAVLIQIWIPIKKEGKQVLITNNQPFSLDPNCKNLAEYRDVSKNYQFSADVESGGFFGLPGRVFLKKLPEWTPDVRFFKREEYPRVNHAYHYDVRGSLALPVFEPRSGRCLGVVEIVTMTQKVNYRPELENICKALQAVDLKSFDIPSPSPNITGRNESYQSTLIEIRNVLKHVCTMHNLPLAQTWALCTQQGRHGCCLSEENYAHCVSTIDSACYVADPQVSGFHEACSEHHLLKGEGVSGKAFLTNEPCYSEDVTAFSKGDYPLSHYARVFNLSAAVAIRVRSTHLETADFVLEFFFPINCKAGEDQRVMLESVLSVVQQTCQSLRVLMDQDLVQEILNKEICSTSAGRLQEEKSLSEPKECSRGSKNFVPFRGNLSVGAKRSEKRQIKTEKTVSLEVLRQYFAGSLKDAAKDIGVCPTTLKRICRQHGIIRWPSRKIKKVGHSLRKLQLVMDSVQGTEGSMKLTSFYNNFPEFISPPNIPLKRPLMTSTVSSHVQQVNGQREGCLLIPATTDSMPAASPGSHNSISSRCFSLKRATSDAKLLDLAQEKTKLLVRSNSQNIFINNHATADTPLMPLNLNNENEMVHYKVKASFREENIRFSLHHQSSFKDLKQEVLRRFDVHDISKVDIKYLDDDAEWVLLTCDSDLDECLDIHRSSKIRVIKIAVVNKSL
ncbi:protein NLP4-like isoform X1 [Primulina huaijiensis]|uniref:protein NLP4-like isoform X1 n=2 Tax=Primulina huaijiensis TaxID=1492673 RepID=UPI003CC74A2B